MEVIEPTMIALARLVADQKFADANRYVEADSADIANLEERIKQRKQENQLMRAFVAAAAPPQQPQQGEPRRRLIFRRGVAEPSEPESEPEQELGLDVRGRILQIASDLARNAPDNVVALEDVVAAVRAAGIEMSSTRPGTSIGNILFKATALWQRVGLGKFKLIG